MGRIVKSESPLVTEINFLNLEFFRASNQQFICLSKDIVKGKCEILKSHFASGKQFAQKGKGQNRKSRVLLTVSIRFLFT